MQKKIVFFYIVFHVVQKLSDEVFLGKQSYVWQQALNRVHVQKSIFSIVLEKLR